MRKARKAKRARRGSRNEIRVYDSHDTTAMIDASRPLKFEDLGLELPAQPPTQVVSIRLPTGLLNELKALGSRDDVPYQALIKLFLADAVKERKKRAA